MGGARSSTQALEGGRAALSVGEWGRARELFEEILADGPSGAALEGIAIATYWAGDEEASLDAWARSFAEYEREGDVPGAAYTAIMLAAEYRIAGNASVANGWLGRGQRLVSECENCVGRGWLEIELSKRADDPGDAERHGREAVQIARELSAPDLEACALSHLGLARIARGDADGGLAVLDEALALATGVQSTDPFTIGDACCTTLIACERIADPERARDWGRVITEFMRRRNFMPLSSWCRAVYAGFLITTGHWADAERELLGALEDAERNPGSNRITALANLAELRLLQGRTEETAQLLAGIEDRPGALGAVVRLHLARGEVELAAEKVERRLETEAQGAADQPALAGLHAAMARVEIERGRTEPARKAVAAMHEAAALAERDDLRALADVLGAQAAALGGERREAKPLEAAVERFTELAMPLDEAIARLELARALAPTHEALAVEQGRVAMRIFERLGAAPYADRAAKLLRDLGAPGRASPRGGGALSKREAEVLALLGAGLSNAEIAERLVISPRTAEHHVAAILRKLELRNRAEAAAYAVREGAQP